MRVLLISLLCSYIFGLLICCLFSFSHHNKFKHQVSGMLYVTTISVSLFLALMLCKNPKTVNILYTLVIMLFFWFLYLLNMYVIALTKKTYAKQPNKKSIREVLIIIINSILAILIIIDTIFIVSNIKYHTYFTMEQIVDIDKAYFQWRTQTTPLYFIHGLLYIIFVIDIIAHIFYRLVTAERYFRKYYSRILFFLLGIVFLNIYYDVLHFPIDYSYLLFPPLTLYIFYFTYYVLPKEKFNQLIKSAADNINDVIACFDCDEKCIYENTKSMQVFKSPDATHNAVDDYMRSAWFHEFIANNSDSVSGEETLAIDGIEHHFLIDYQKFWDRKKRIFGSYIKLEDNTDAYKRLHEQKYKATHDLLTGLYNRREFFSKVEKILDAEPDVPRYMVATNIKNFKLINDLFGLKLGDTILKTQAKMLQQANFPDCIQARISADKFAMLIRKTDFNPALAEKNTESIQNITNSLNLKLKFYIGVYEITNPQESAANMYDKAMLAIQDIHGDYEKTISFYNILQMEKLLKEKSVLCDFSPALRNNEFQLYFQPIFDNKGKCKTAEALIRWKHQLIGTLSPNYFLEILEKAGYILSLDKNIWDLAIQKVKKWQNNGHNDFSISLNISPKDFLYDDLYIVFTNLVEKYDVPPQCIKLEIPEAAFMENIESNIEVINSLHKYGFQIAIDNFGTGFSSFNMLKQLDTNVLKLNMDFIDNNEKNTRSSTILKSMVSMSKELEMELIIVGIETKKQYEYVKKAGVKFFQGFYLSKPISSEEFEKKYMGGKS